MALAALCDDEDEWGRTWRRVIQHRFRSRGGLHGHAVGNLLIVALWELLAEQDAHSTVAGLDWVARLLKARGRVLPMASVPIDIAAEVQGADPARPHEVTVVRGQVECASTPGKVRGISLIPPDPPACPEAVAAIEDADWVVFGPGSWFTSVLPHLKVPELAGALTATRARRVVALNLAPQPGETDDFSPQAHLEVLQAHAPDLRIDVVLAERTVVDDAPALDKAVRALGGTLVLMDVAAADGSPKHDPERLGQAFAQIFSSRDLVDGNPGDCR
jgi:uncharacterized cofD-like protein